ncbi:MAG: hypothetical protein KAV82_06685 [Phycisphaerae bacterium]|nr:hypothetical protein [Phycisphaerae bacterium]
MELLVVVAILALLIAVLLPSLRKARQQSKLVVCQSNLRQIAVGWQNYLIEHQGAFLQGINVRLSYGGRQGTAESFGGNPDKPKPKPLNPHLSLPLVIRDDAEVFHCPSDRGSPYAGPTHFDYYGTSYHTNVMLVGQNKIQFNPFTDPCRYVLNKVNRRLSGIRRSQIGNESRLILLGDHGWYNEWGRGTNYVIEWHHHRATHNVAFMDGHVSFMRIHKGVHVTPEYVVIPFKDLADEACQCQPDVYDGL